MKIQTRRLAFVTGCFLFILLALTKLSPAQAAPIFHPANVELVEMTGGLSQPVFITNASDGSGRLFVVERAGQIRIVANGVLLTTPFLDIDPIVNSTSGEQGLLALAFHPNYITNGYFYTVHTDQSGALVLARFTRSASDPNLADPGNMMTLLTIPHPTNTNHNGGTLAFGPDGYLYWSTGDGGGGGDLPNNAQNLTVLLGKILRLDIDSGPLYSIPPSNPFYGDPTPGIRKEIWAYGLRNPWRMSFDRLTGDLFIGDVGQGSREEIGFQPSKSTGGENYGWRVMEGSLCYNPSSGCNQSGKVLPIAEYDHSVGCSVTGGYVYRGADFPTMQSVYFYGDFCSGILFYLQGNPVDGWTTATVEDTPHSISTFGESEDGELYFADYGTGAIYQIVYNTFADVSHTHAFGSYIQGFYNAGITVGCSQSPRMYCPDNLVTRGEMAVFIERAMGNFAPTPFPSGMFADLPYPGLESFTPFIEEYYNDGITVGCNQSPLRYCPQNNVTRGEMAVFIERAIGNFAPAPFPTGMFSDVPYPGMESFTPFIEEFYNDGITVGCLQSPLMYCPQNYVTRGEMAVFMVRAFGIPLP